MINENLIRILSDLFVNLSAGWFGASIIIPISKKDSDFDWTSLILNFILGIVSLTVSYLFINLI